MFQNGAKSSVCSQKRHINFKKRREAPCRVFRSRFITADDGKETTATPCRGREVKAENLPRFWKVAQRKPYFSDTAEIARSMFPEEISEDKEN